MSRRSPALPWEMIESVIDHSAKNTRTLYSFTLTCHDLHPRSTMLLLAHVTIKNRNQGFDLCDVLRAKPHLQPHVRSVTIPAHEFSPHPLLRMLPNLSEIQFKTGFGPRIIRPIVLHASILMACRQLGQCIRTLSLHGLVFPSLSAFSHILLSLPRIESLSCMNLGVKNGRALPELITRRLSEQLHLRTLTVSTYAYLTAVVITQFFGPSLFNIIGYGRGPQRTRQHGSCLAHNSSEAQAHNPQLYMLPLREKP